MRPDQSARDRILADLDASFAVDAGAGTGKTTLLVGRLAALVAERGVPLRRIAAITFTDKAAGELVGRLRKELEDRLAKDKERAPRLLQALRDLEQASVSTIHAFCQGLLREYPIEAGVDPRFKVLDRVQSEAFEAQAWEGWLKRSLAQSVEALDWFDALGGTFTQALDLKKFLLSNRSLLGEVPEPKLPDPTDLVRRLEHGVTFLIERGVSCKDKGDLLWVQILDFRKAWQSLRLLPPEERLFRLPGLPIPKPKSGSQTKWEKAALADAREECLGLLEARDDFSARLRDAALRAVQRWLGGYLDHYARQKNRAGFLDFDDLLARARDLLKVHPEVREELKGRYDRIFVDEFQDTDPLQVEIVFLLAEKIGGKAKGWREASLAPGKLFLVGDPKQSIYRFRRADVEIYEEAKARLVACGGQVENLTENFRTQAPIVDWVNERFSALLEGVGLPYVPQHPARGAESGFLAPLSVLPVPSAEEKENVEASRRREAEAVADALRDLLQSGKATIEDPHRKERRKLRAGDVAILFRALSNSEEAYEDALRSRGIPFQVVGGKRFYHRSEVAALESLLRALASPADENACVALLRSPLFGFADEELLLHRSRAGKFSFLHTASGRMKEAFSQLRAWHQAIRGKSPSDALGFLYEKSPILAVTASQPHGEQRVANLLKVLDQARALEASENFTLRGFVRWLGEQRDSETLEGEAPGAGDQGDRVTLMTLHKAKGLEFPVVVLSGITSERHQAPSALLERAKGKCEIKLGAKDLGIRTLGYGALEAKEDLQDAAETIRLLYVGCTRARDSLWLPLCSGGFPAAGFLGPLGLSETDKRFVQVKPAGTDDPEDPPALVVNLVEKDKSTQAVEAVATRWKEAMAHRTEKTLALLGVQALKPVTSLLKVEPEKMSREGAALDGLGDPEEILPVGRGSAQALGTLTHLLMEKAWGWDPDLIRKAAKAWGPDQGLRGSTWEQQAAEAAEMAIRAYNSPILMRAASSPRRCSEVPVFDAQHSAGAIFGILDLAFLEDDQWVLVDYKTDKDPDKLMVKYQEQLRLYSDLLKNATGMPVKEACLLFLRTGEARVVSLNG